MTPPDAPDAPRDLLEEAARNVVKAGWALSDVGHFLPDTAEGHAFDEALDALEDVLRGASRPGEPEGKKS